LIPKVEYLRFSDAREAADYVASHAGGAAFLAGGTDVMVRMRAGKMKARSLADISRIESLAGIRRTKQGIEIGAMTTIEEVRRSPDIQRRFQALWKASSAFAAWQVRNIATLGGNLCNASPAADMAPPLMVFDARLETLGPHGRRSIPMDRFFAGPGRTVLRGGELLEKVFIPNRLGESDFLKLGRRRASALAVVSVAVRLATKGGRVSEARVALGSVAPTPVRARNVERSLIGRVADERTFAKAAALVEKDIRPISDVRAGAEYRRDMASIFVREALISAMGGGASS